VDLEVGTIRTGTVRLGTFQTLLNSDDDRNETELGLMDYNDDAHNFAALCRGEEMRAGGTGKSRHRESKRDAEKSSVPILTSIINRL